MRGLTYILFFVLFSTTALSAQNDNGENNTIESYEQLDKTEWKDLVKDLKYDKEKRKELDIDPPRLRGSSLGPIANTFLIFLGLAVLLLILFHFLGFGPSTKAKNIKINSDGVELSINEIEEDIENVNIEKQIEIALNERNFKKALRLQYLLVIQKLSIAQLIDYQKEKTNRDYLNELSESNLFDSFQHMTHYFENYWYGDKVLTEAVYRRYRSDYDSFFNLLNSESRLKGEEYE